MKKRGLVLLILLLAGCVPAFAEVSMSGGGSVNLHSPGAIGDITPNTGKFTTLDATMGFKVVGHSSLDSADFFGNVHTSNASTATFDGPVIVNGTLTGNSSTAAALAANGANCSAGQYPKGVDASGAVESCTAVTLTTDVTGILPAANGGVPTTTKGDLAGYSTTNARIPVGADTQVLTADSTQALGLKWAAASGGATVGIINASHDVSVTGNESYSGCGFIPKAVEVFVSQATTFPASWAWTDGTKYIGLYSYGAVGGGGTFVNMGPSTNLIAKYVFASTSASATFVSFDASGVTLNWTKVGSPTGVYTIDVFCIK